MLGLSVLEYIEAADIDALRSQQVSEVDIHVPMQPCPEPLAVTDWRIRKFSNAVKPALSIIERGFHSLHFVASAVACIAFDAVCFAFLCCCEGDLLALRWLDDDGVEVLLVACSVRVPEQGLYEFAVFLSDKRGQDRLSHLTQRPPTYPGIISRTGYP